MAAPQENFAMNTYGRFVSGDLLEKKTVDHLGKKIVDEEKHKFNFGIAFRKDDPVLAAFWTQLYTHLSTAWANDQVKLQALGHYFATNPQTNYYNMTGLSMKISDGDLPSGKDNTVNKNTVGHVILWCATKYPPKVTDTAYQEIPTESMKRGYYCAIVGSFADNELAYSADGKGAGIYLNIKGLILNAEGDVIEGGGIDVAKAMGGAQGPTTAMPTGARALGAGAGIPNGMPGQTQMPGAPQQQMPVQGQPQMGHAPMQQQPNAGVPQNAMPGTASVGNGMPGAPQQQMPNAHPAILGGPGAPQQQVQQPQTAQMPNMGAPANMGMPGQ